MAHELEIKKDGTAAMMYVKAGGVPWHGQGVALDNPPTAAEAIKAAGLDWKVSVHLMEATVNLPGRKPFNLDAQTRMVVRESDGQRLSEVGPKWNPLQNVEAFEWFDPFIKSGECSFETAGSLFEGERIWVLAKLNRDPLVIVGDDTITKYLMLSNNHSDKRSARVSLSPIRVICANTMAAHFSNKQTKFLGVKHTANIKDNLEKVREVINTANADFEATAEQYRALTKVQVDQTLLKKYIKLVFKDKDDEETSDAEITSSELKAKKPAKEDDKRLMENKIIPLFESGRGSTLPGVKGTLWGAYNSITEYLSWNAGRTADARLDSLWFGQNSNVNRRALEVALSFAKQAA
jgi:phage/plasmid-like protein (TIGR03299 family)